MAQDSQLDRFARWKPQRVRRLCLPGRSVLQHVKRVLADGLQVRSPLLLLGRGLGEGGGLQAGEGVDGG